MRRLTLPPNPPSHLDWYLSIRNKKRDPTRSDLSTRHAIIERRYNEYARAFAESKLERIAKERELLAIADALRSCYLGATKPLLELKESIRNSQGLRALKYCPMCGITLPSTFDHFLPICDFPEFSVHVMNLVPACSLCNSTKGNSWLDSQAARQFLHPFMDDFLDTPFLEVVLHFSNQVQGVGATFELVRPEGLPKRHWRLVQTHFKKLDLLKRYNRASNDEVAEMIATCRVLPEMGNVSSRSFLRSVAAERAVFHGASDWKALLMAALAEHADLESWIEEARLAY